MTEEKRNRLIAAITVNVVILIVVLAVVCIYQIVELSTLNNLKKNMQTQIEYYQQGIDKAENELEHYKTDEWLIDKAYEYGWSFNGK